MLKINFHNGTTDNNNAKISVLWNVGVIYLGTTPKHTPILEFAHGHFVNEIASS